MPEEVGRWRVLISRRRKKFLEGKACEHCGSKFDLTVDHMVDAHLSRLNPQKRAIVQVLCRTCHFIKDHDQSMWFEQEGFLRHGQLWRR